MRIEIIPEVVVFSASVMAIRLVRNGLMVDFIDGQVSEIYACSDANERYNWLCRILDVEIMD